MTPPATYRIADKPPVFPCWVFDSRKWIYERERIFPTDTHWCFGMPVERPTHDPTAPATPAISAAKGGDIPRTPTDSEMLDWLLSPEKHGSDAMSIAVFHRNRGAGWITDRAAIAAAMQKKSQS